MAQGFNLIMWWCEETHFLFFFSFHFHEALINNIYFFFLLDAFLKVRASRFWVTSFRLLNTCTPFPFCQSNYDLRQWALQAPTLNHQPSSSLWPPWHSLVPCGEEGQDSPTHVNPPQCLTRLSQGCPETSTLEGPAEGSMLSGASHGMFRRCLFCFIFEKSNLQIVFIPK